MLTTQIALRRLRLNNDDDVLKVNNMLVKTQEDKTRLLYNINLRCNLLIEKIINNQTSNPETFFFFHFRITLL